MDDANLNKNIELLAECLKEFYNNLCDNLKRLVKEIAKVFEKINKSNKSNKFNFKPVKNLIKPYKQPYKKIKYRARANI